MTATRNLPKTGTISGASHVEDVADTLGSLYREVGGLAQNVQGTNAITFSLPVSDGLLNLNGLLKTVLIPVNNNSGAVTVTLNDSTTGTKPLTDRNGNALNGGELIAGASYIIFFVSSSDHWRVSGVSSGSIGNGSDAFAPIRFYTFQTVGTDTWTVPYNCYAYIHLIGAGGSGGHAGGGTTRSATGGGGGGYCLKRVLMQSGTIASLNIGEGGAAVSVNTIGNGNTGGNTTFTAAGISLAAFGGGGGRSGVNPLAGASGGVATGGDFNFQGGSSGASNRASGFTGGGGVDFTGQGLVDSEDIDSGTGTSGQAEGAGLPDALSIRIAGLDNTSGTEGNPSGNIFPSSFGGGGGGYRRDVGFGIRGGNGAILIGISHEVTNA